MITESRKTSRSLLDPGGWTLNINAHRARDWPLGSQTWSSFFNGRYGSPDANPITTPFFFESKTARLPFVRHHCAQSWWLFLRFPRENAAADYPCNHDCPENPKLHLLHCGVLRRLTPLDQYNSYPAAWRCSPRSAAPSASLIDVKQALTWLR